jgi:mannose-1-phosphate guanylyltransferase/mannose-1-phosphate guanylyltransferase/mannose-6-phosphate isomerase
MSRPGRPKPFLRLNGAETLLARTLERVSDPARFARPILIGSTADADALRAEAPSLKRLVLEPVGRNTAPAVTAAALLADRPDRLLMVIPSDHFIRDGSAFRAAVATAAPLAAKGRLMTFGIRPGYAEPGYGYIRRGKPLGEGAFTVARFIEKPDVERARGFVASGDHDWNAGIFLFRADRFLEEVRARCPELLACVARALPEAREGEEIRLTDAFGACPNISVDVAVMERAERVGVVPVDMGWSDVGSWDMVFETADRDRDGNAVAGPVEALGATGCLLQSDGPHMIVLDVEDLYVVATAKGVLITRRGSSERLKELLDSADSLRRH